VKDSTTKIGHAGNGLAFFVFGLRPPSASPESAERGPLRRRRFAEPLLRRCNMKPAAVAAEARRTTPSPTSKPTASRVFPSNVETSDANRPADISGAWHPRSEPDLIESVEGFPLLPRHPPIDCRPSIPSASRPCDRFGTAAMGLCCRGCRRRQGCRAGARDNHCRVPGAERRTGRPPTALCTEGARHHSP